MNNKTKNKIACLLMALIFIFNMTGCGIRELYMPTNIDQDDEWIRMVTEYRKASSDNPGNHELKTSLKRAEFDAAEHFYTQANGLKGAGNIDAAIASLQKGLVVMPENEKVSLKLIECISIRESENAFKDAQIQKASGNTDEAQKLLEKALELQPSNPAIIKALEDIMAEKEKEDGIFASKKKATMKFSNTDSKTVFDFIANTYGISVIYDEGVKSVPVSVSGENLNLRQVLEMITSSGTVFYKKIGADSILVIQDTRAKRDQYEDLIIRNYQLTSIKAADMSSILKNALNLKRVSVNDSLNIVSVRDTEDMQKLVKKIIQVNDQKPAEVIFDVEIMEVNRTKSEQLGLNYGSQIKLALPNNDTIGSAMNSTFMNVLKQGVLTLPAFTLNFFKQDVDAKMLANPRVRVIEGKKAKIHIGDRVPLRSSIIQDATGQVRYTYEYKDIGVMLEVTPKINLDNTVNVMLRLEVSTLGSNIGTQAEPAYSIGTRDAETTMLLKDGETAILGGLIRDEERSNKLKIPGLGDIPVIGSLFTTSTDDYSSRTDVLLTITPRVVRSWEYLSKELRDIYSGTENRISSESKYSAPQDAGGKKKSKPIKAVSVTEAETVTTSAQPAVEVKNGIILSFSEIQYILQTGHDNTIKITAENIENVSSMTVKAAYNSTFVKFLQADRIMTGAAQNMTVDNSKAESGMVELKFSFDTDKSAPGKTDLAELKFSGVKPGVSYLVFLESIITDKDGKEQNAQRTASRFVVK